MKHTHTETLMSYLEALGMSLGLVMSCGLYCRVNLLVCHGEPQVLAFLKSLSFGLLRCFKEDFLFLFLAYAFLVLVLWEVCGGRLAGGGVLSI